MAEAGGNAKAHQTSFLEDASKEVLLERYLDLKFVDDDIEMSCKRCCRVLIHHYMANCGHLLCRNCQRILCIGERWKSRCPECKVYIIHMDGQDAEVERRVHELRLHCPNHKYGCKEHLRKCRETRETNLPALYIDSNSNSNIHIRISELSKHVNELSEKCDRMLKLRAVDEGTRQQLNIQLDNMETIIKGSGLTTAKLQVEMANTFSRVTEMERECERRSEEWNRRLSKMEMQQSKMDDSLKQNSEVFDHSRGSYSQREKDAMEQNIKILARDFDRKMNAMGENVNRLSAELENKSAEFASQRRAIEASLTRKFEELDENRRKDFQMKFDQFSAEIKNELRRFMDEMRRTNANDTSDKILTMPRVPRPTRTPILTNGHGIAEYNILLLGPIGSGKSTFVNSLANYLKFKTFGEALVGPTECLIPGSFTHRKSAKELKIITFGEPSDNEDRSRVGRHSHVLHSKTIACKSYDFYYNKCLIRVIDSPGIYSFQTGEMPLNLTSILDSLKKYRQLHAITIVMNGSDGFLFSKWSVEDVLSRLGQSAATNVTWLFTQSNNPLPESTNSAIIRMLSNISRKRQFETRIPMNESNSFHMDNRGFRHLILRSNGISEESKEISTTWSHSVHECGRMLQYVINGQDGKGLQPHLANNTFRLY